MPWKGTGADNDIHSFFVVTVLDDLVEICVTHSHVIATLPTGGAQEACGQSQPHRGEAI